MTASRALAGLIVFLVLAGATLPGPGFQEKAPSLPPLPPKLDLPRIDDSGKWTIPQTASSATFQVRAYGARGDGKTDDTPAFQKALDEAGKIGGGTVFAGPGNFLFAGHLSVPNGVTLEGTWKSVPAHNGLRDAGLPKPTDGGTTFLVTEGAGKEEGPSFITLHTNSTLKGVVLYYPNQKTDEEPVPYPYAVAMRGKNPAVLQVELLNPYKGIDASRNERHLIRDVQGQPLRRGIFVDAIYDVGRIENVHFNPWWSIQPKLLKWQMENGEAFVFGRTDWQYVLNTFCFGYKVGYRFLQTRSGGCNGNFLGIGADDCYTALVVDGCTGLDCSSPMANSFRSTVRTRPWSSSERATAAVSVSSTAPSGDRATRLPVSPEKERWASAIAPLSSGITARKAEPRCRSRAARS